MACMRAWPAKPKRQVRIEIIPMIDVMMFLLVFFVLISINVLPALGLKIKPPASSNADKIVERTKITISLDADGKTYFEGLPVEIAAIPDKLKAVSSPDKKLTVIIAGDGESSLQTLISVLDSLKIAGVTSTQIVTKAK